MAEDRFAWILKWAVVGAFFAPLGSFLPWNTVAPSEFWLTLESGYFLGAFIITIGAIIIPLVRGFKGMDKVSQSFIAVLLAASLVILVLGLASTAQRAQEAAGLRGDIRDQKKRMKNMEKSLGRIADKMDVDRNQSPQDLAKAIIDQLTRPWRLTKHQRSSLRALLAEHGARGEGFTVHILPIEGDKQASIYARDFTDALSSHYPKWGYIQPSRVWADTKTVGLRIAISEKDDTQNPPEIVRVLEKILEGADIPYQKITTDQSIPKGGVGLVIGAPPINR